MHRRVDALHLNPGVRHGDGFVPDIDDGRMGTRCQEISLAAAAQRRRHCELAIRVPLGSAPSPLGGVRSRTPDRSWQADAAIRHTGQSPSSSSGAGSSRVRCSAGHFFRVGELSLERPQTDPAPCRLSAERRQPDTMAPERFPSGKGTRRPRQATSGRGHLVPSGCELNHSALPPRMVQFH
jgi:hypothetical protein